MERFSNREGFKEFTYLGHFFKNSDRHIKNIVKKLNIAIFKKQFCQTLAGRSRAPMDPKFGCGRRSQRRGKRRYLKCGCCDWSSALQMLSCMRRQTGGSIYLNIAKRTTSYENNRENFENQKQGVCDKMCKRKKKGQRS